ncbi:MAG: hypothetical protein E5X55_21750 [Mesorhizobium sp.]|nr:MAG: hypothetical protein EOR73_09510 [Mesorhizobium sp.]TIP71693.1 MAG: hypothetical protein E5X55_21750 [Mesorhizobium sp.]TJV96097.1 MAG: hypothetical protein E5X52_20805 [Mesorhizobium sp.]
MSSPPPTSTASPWSLPASGISGIERLTLPLVGRVGERSLRSKVRETGWGSAAPTPLRFADRPSPQGGG